MNYAIFGTFYNGITSERKPGALRVDSAGMVHIDGTIFEPCSCTEIKIPPRVANVPRLIELPNDARFETEHNEAVDRLSKIIFQHRPLFVPHNWESKLHYIAASVLLVFSVLIGLVQYGIPFASKKLAHALPPEHARMLAEHSLDQLDQTYFDRSKLDPARKGEIRTMLEAHQPEADGFKFTLYFRQSPTVGANAFALPDGSIIITDELVALAQTNEEILSIIFHEMGHVVHRHALRRALESAGLYVIYSWVIGDLDTLSSVVLTIPTIIVGAKYSRSHEWEADTYTLERMTELRLDPMHFANIMESLEKDHEESRRVKNSAKVSIDQKPRSEGDDTGGSNDREQTANTPNSGQGEKQTMLDFISSHPATSERVARFKEASEQLHNERVTR